MSPTARSTICLFSLLFALCACGRTENGQEAGAATLQRAQVDSARIVLPPPRAPMAAGYFELHNPGKTALVLEALESTAFESVEMHETVEQDGMSRMRPLANATVAPGETLRFEPGGMHLMLMGPRLASAEPAPPTITLKLRLRAAAGGEMRELDAPFAVEHSGQRPSEDPHAHH
ncbi:MAG: copper chaperone PCu(A)C [Panacagrimonas sp.]